jgi:hypothetical protein
MKERAEKESVEKQINILAKEITKIKQDLKKVYA